MKKPFINLTVALILIIGSVLLLQTNFVHAEETGPGMIASAIRSVVNPILADFANLTMTAASWALIFAGAVLDVSIKLTLNIKDFVNATPAIFTVWKTLRDITGLFFIFYLLFAAIQMMTGFGKGSYGSTIKNIVIAGVLINFSFFIVSIGIDVSNITSQAIYKAMVPNSQTMKLNEKTGLAEIVRDNGQSKISNIFMNSLRIQKIYDAKGNRLGTNITDPIKIVLIGITGVLMMLTTAASLILAALAFVARLVILLFLLAFSSLWFAGMVIPQVREQVQMFEKALYAQLIFMPVYLLLMYVALSIINGSNFFSAGDIGGVASTITGPNWVMPYIILGVNFAIVIFILNLPLVVGLSMGAQATDWLKKGMSRFDAVNVWKNVGLWTKDKGIPGAWNNTGGRAASAISRSEWLKDSAGRSKLGELSLKGIKGVAGSYNKKLESQVKARTEFAESLGYDEKEVRRLESYTKDLYDKEREARLAGRTAEADMYKQRAETRKKNVDIMIANKKKERQASYANRINTGSPETLFLKVARKDKVAAAKINVGVWQKQLDKKKEDIKELKRSLDIVQRDIRNDVARTGAASVPNAEEKRKLETKIENLTRNPAHGGNISDMGTDDLQEMINGIKLIT